MLFRKSVWAKCRGGPGRNVSHSSKYVSPAPSVITHLQITSRRHSSKSCNFQSLNFTTEASASKYVSREAEVKMR